MKSYIDEEDKFLEVIGSEFLSKSKKVNFEEMSVGNVLCLYFCQESSPNCIELTKFLIEAYSKINSEKFKLVDILLVPECTSKMGFDVIYENMPWHAIPYNDPRINVLKKYYGVTTFPTLTVLDYGGEVIAQNAVQELMEEGHSYLKHFGKTKERKIYGDKVPFEDIGKGIIKFESKGGRHGDSKDFDDFNSHIKKEIANGNTVHIAAIEMKAHHVLVGLSITYEIYNKEKEKVNTHVIKHEGQDKDLKQTVTYTAEKDEEIKAVLISTGSLVDSITFVTNKGRRVSCGGTGGTKFRFGPPKGKYLISLGGSTNGCIHNCYAYFNA